MKIETVSAVLTKVWEAHSRTADMGFDLCVLNLALLARETVPDAEWFYIDPSDQDDHFTPGTIQAPDGQCTDLEDDNDGWEWTSSISSYQVENRQDIFVSAGTHLAGRYKLNVAKALEEMTRKYEGVLGEIENPFPDPTDTTAVLAWLNTSDHQARPDDDPESGDRCKDCGHPVTWNGPSPADWSHVA